VKNILFNAQRRWAGTESHRPNECRLCLACWRDPRCRIYIITVFSLALDRCLERCRFPAAQSAKETGHACLFCFLFPWFFLVFAEEPCDSLGAPTLIYTSATLYDYSTGFVPRTSSASTSSSARSRRRATRRVALGSAVCMDLRHWEIALGGWGNWQERHPGVQPGPKSRDLRGCRPRGGGHVPPPSGSAGPGRLFLRVGTRHGDRYADRHDGRKVRSAAKLDCCDACHRRLWKRRVAWEFRLRVERVWSAAVLGARPQRKCNALTQCNVILLSFEHAHSLSVPYHDAIGQTLDTRVRPTQQVQRARPANLLV